MSRDFNTFELGDNPAELAGGVMTEIAGRMGVDLGDGCDPAAYGELVGRLGASKELRTNRPPTEVFTVQEAGELLEVSGVQRAMNRSLWTPDFPTPTDAPVVITGGMANWMDRTGRTVEQLPNSEVILAVGSRVMGTATEIPNSNVASFMGDVTHNPQGRAPQEFEFALRYTRPNLEGKGKTVTMLPSSTRDGAAIANEVVGYAESAGLLEPGKALAVARVANAGVQLATQIRAAARKKNEAFDTDPTQPQLFVVTDEFAPAKNAEQLRDPAHYQSGYTGLRQLALTAKLIAEAQQ